MSKSAIITAAGVAAISATAVCVGSLIALHLLPTGLSPIRNAVSQYGITRYRLGYRIQTIAMGLAAIACAVGVAELPLGSAGLVVGLFVILGAARLAISWFPMDVPGTPRTETGRRHGLLATAAFGAAGLAALRLGFDLSRASLWSNVRGAVVALGIVMLVSVFTMGATRGNASLRRYFGIIERVFYLGAIVFLLLVGAELVRTH